MGDIEENHFEADVCKAQQRHDLRGVLRAARRVCAVIVMRDIEELSYKEMPTRADLPIGTVIPRLGRARGKTCSFPEERIA